MSATLTVLAISAYAGKEALKKVVGAIYDTLSNEAQKKLKKLKNEREIDRLYNQLKKVRLVKTIGQVDKAIDLKEFYCPSHIKFGNKRILVTTLEDLSFSGNILVEGIAGQGKSIFLRYLAGVEMVRGNVVPVFIELRKLEDGQNLVDLILRGLEGFGLSVDVEIFSELADSGRLLLLLDAFDEVAEAFKLRVISELQILLEKHDKMRVVITSRPDSGIIGCPEFHAVKLSNLHGDEFALVVYKLMDDKVSADRLINQVKNNRGGIVSLLFTPLLVTLLVIRYKMYQEVPEQLSEFYENIFQDFLKRHDGVKPGYKRLRKCSMNDVEYRRVFESMCFLSKRYDGGVLSHQAINAISGEALKDQRLNEDSQKLLEDIVSITCLIVKDGEEYRFIHKSVQEYYAASYIKQKPDVVVKMVYQKLFSRKYNYQYTQELLFLREIDSYRYMKYGVLEYLKSFFECSVEMFLQEPNPAHRALVMRKVGEHFVHFERDKRGWSPRGFEVVSWPLTFAKSDRFDSVMRTGMRLCFREEVLTTVKHFHGGAIIRVNIKEVLKLPDIEDFLGSVEQYIELIAKDLFQQGKEALRIIESAEQSKAILDLEAIKGL